MSKYKWNPPTWTEGERKRSREGYAEMVRKAAEGWDTDGDWQRAMGVEPRASKNASAVKRERSGEDEMQQDEQGN